MRQRCRRTFFSWQRVHTNVARLLRLLFSVADARASCDIITFPAPKSADCIAVGTKGSKMPPGFEGWFVVALAIAGVAELPQLP